MAESPTDGSHPPATDSLPEEAQVRTVAGLNDAIADLLAATDHLTFDYVVGDVTDHRVVNGHVHFDLDEDDASIHCIAFGSRRDADIDALEDGNRVAVAGDLSYYQARGSCSVLVTDVVPLGEGTYSQQYEEHRQALREAGLFEDEHKAPLPPYPDRVGIVTSADSDAREDAVTSIRARHPGIDVVIQDATVQGDDAIPELLEAVSRLDGDPDVDLIVVTRGGGADTTLRVFNDPALCRVLFETDTPVVVGVGHERDESLAAKVADERVMTPTDVGSVVPDHEALLETHADLTTDLEDAYHRLASRRLETTAADLESAFKNHADTVVGEARTALDHALESVARERLTDLEARLDHAVDTIAQREHHEAATAELEATYERRQRRQRLAIAALVLLVLALLAYVFLIP